MIEEPFPNRSFESSPIASVTKGIRKQVTPLEFGDDTVFHYSIPSVQATGSGEREPGSSIESNKWLIPEECVLISRLNPRKATVCRASPRGAMTLASTEFVPLTAGNATDNRFIEFVLGTPQVTNFLSSMATSVTRSHQRVNPRDITGMRVPWPSVEVRRAIVDYLDHETAEIDAFIRDQVVLIDLCEERRQSTIDAYVYAAGYERTRLKFLGDLRTGIALGARYDEETQEYPYLRVANVQTDHVDLTHVATIHVPKHVADSNRLQERDVLMTEGGDRDKLGRGALWHAEIDDMLHQNHIFAFRCNPKLSPHYLVYVLESSHARYYFDVTAKQSTNLASTNSTTVRRFQVPQRNIEEQKKIVASLDDECASLDQAISDARRTIELSRERRAALISAAVTGQIDVTKRRRPVAEVLEDEVLERV